MNPRALAVAALIAAVPACTDHPNVGQATSGGGSRSSGGATGGNGSGSTGVATTGAGTTAGSTSGGSSSGGACSPGLPVLPGETSLCNCVDGTGLEISSCGGAQTCEEACCAHGGYAGYFSGALDGCGDAGAFAGSLAANLDGAGAFSADLAFAFANPSVANGENIVVGEYSGFAGQPPCFAQGLGGEEQELVIELNGGAAAVGAGTYAIGGQRRPSAGQASLLRNDAANNLGEVGASGSVTLTAVGTQGAGTFVGSFSVQLVSVVDGGSADAGILAGSFTAPVVAACWGSGSCSVGSCQQASDCCPVNGSGAALSTCFGNSCLYEGPVGSCSGLNGPCGGFAEGEINCCSGYTCVGGGAPPPSGVCLLSPTGCVADAGPTASYGYGSSRPSFVPALPTEFLGCTGNSDCQCPLVCAPDSDLALLLANGTQTSLCETSCQTNSDCPDPLTVCRGGSCSLNYCVTSATWNPDAGSYEDAGGSFGGPCDARSTGDGTCQVVYANDNYGVLFGVCVQGGTATSTCQVGATVTSPAQLCAQGSFCLGNSYDGCDTTAAGGPAFCEQACNASSGGSCPVGTGCVAWAPEEPQGYCGPPPGSAFGLCAPVDGGGLACATVGQSCADAGCCPGSYCWGFSDTCVADDTCQGGPAPGICSCDGYLTAPCPTGESCPGPIAHGHDSYCCVNSGGGCQADGDCCSDACAGGTCAAGPWAIGDSCTPGECGTTLVCSSGGTCACLTAGTAASASQSAECCGGWGATAGCGCSDTGGRCMTNADCCGVSAGQCLAFACN